MTEELKSKINKCKTLDELFKLWKQAHKDEENFFETFPECPSCGNFPNRRFKESFCKDGVTALKGNINKHKTITEDVKILFILKESNCGGHKVNNEFWFDEYTLGDSYRDTYSKRLKLALEKVLGKSNVSYDTKFGYMNLNKRGGYNRTMSTKLEAYTIKYYPFIKRQIEILSPQYIVFCGCFNEFINACKSDEENKENKKLYNWKYYKNKFGGSNYKNPKFHFGKNSAYIVNIYHPSCRNVYKEFYKSLEILETFKNKEK